MPKESTNAHANMQSAGTKKMATGKVRMVTGDADLSKGFAVVTPKGSSPRAATRNDGKMK